MSTETSPYEYVEAVAGLVAKWQRFSLWNATNRRTRLKSNRKSTGGSLESKKGPTACTVGLDN